MSRLTTFAVVLASVVSVSVASANTPAKSGKASGAAAKSATAVTTTGDATAKPAETVEKKSEESTKRTKAAISGYVQPQFGMRYRPGAVPRDRTDYSADDTRAGVIVNGNPLPDWSYTLHVTVGAGLIDAVTASEAIDRDGDGQPDDVSVLSRASSGILLERAAVDWDPNQHIGVSVGQMRIPLTVENQISNTKLMFPNRSAANDVFLQGF